MASILRLAGSKAGILPALGLACLCVLVYSLLSGLDRSASVDSDREFPHPNGPGRPDRGSAPSRERLAVLERELGSEWLPNDNVSPDVESHLSAGEYERAFELAASLANTPHNLRQLGRVCFLWAATDKWSCIGYLKGREMEFPQTQAAIRGALDGIVLCHGEDRVIALGEVMSVFHESDAANLCMQRLALWCSLGGIRLADINELFAVSLEIESRTPIPSSSGSLSRLDSLTGLLGLGMRLNEFIIGKEEDRQDGAFRLGYADLREIRDSCLEFATGNPAIKDVMNMECEADIRSFWRALGEVSGRIDGMGAIGLSLPQSATPSIRDAYLTGVGGTIGRDHSMAEVAAFCQEESLGSVWKGYIGNRLNIDNGLLVLKEIGSLEEAGSLRHEAAAMAVRRMFQIDSMRLSAYLAPLPDSEARTEMVRTLANCLEDAGRDDEAAAWKQLISGSSND